MEASPAIHERRPPAARLGEPQRETDPAAAAQLGREARIVSVRTANEHDQWGGVRGRRRTRDGETSAVINAGHRLRGNARHADLRTRMGSFAADLRLGGSGGHNRHRGDRGGQCQVSPHAGDTSPVGGEVPLGGQDLAEALFELALEGVADRALGGALDELLEEALDHELLGVLVAEPV